MNTDAALANAVLASFDTMMLAGNTSLAIRVMAVTGKFKSSRRSAIAMACDALGCYQTADDDQESKKTETGVVVCRQGE